jgi:formylglycine-generating enzyme required for sulfatase activity
MSDCGPNGDSCCASLPVQGGGFDRSYDGLSAGFTSNAYPASVSTFRLDRFEVTVGRFRQFVTAVTSGWLPAPGSGKHSHANGGLGLVDVGADAGAYETGWDATWDSNLPASAGAWNTGLAGGTWTATARSDEALPITEVNWYEAYAFCIWDHGFLPSESEWNYAAGGGSQQRAYPWSPAYPPGSTAFDCTNANYVSCPAGAARTVGSESPAGDGRWGQSDLAGNVWEWNLDWLADYATPCADCANLAQGSARVDRGGSFMSSPSALLVSNRGSYAPAGGTELVGVRCARSP